MRLLHFSETGALVGGVERYLQALLGGSTPGVEHAVVTHSEGPCAYSGSWPARSWPWLAPRTGAGPGPSISGSIPLFHAPPAPAALADLGRAPFAVFCHDHRWWCPSGTRYYLRTERPCDIRAGTAACGIRYAPLRCGSLRPGNVAGGFMRAAKGRETLAEAAVVLCASTHMASQAVRHGAVAARTHVVPLPLTAPSPADVPLESPPLMLCASRLTPEKGIEPLVDAFARMTVDARLLLAGDGMAREQLEAIIAVHPRKDGITLAGHLPPGQLEAALARAAVVAVPSVWPEPFGLVGIEALAAGKPVVSSASGGSADWSREELGVIVADPFDAGAFARALDRAVSEPVWRERARTAGRAWVTQRHSLEAHTAALTRALAGVAAQAEAGVT